MTARLVVGLTLAVLLGATIYEALVALGVIELGSLPGEEPPAEGWILAGALLAMLAAVVILLFTRRLPSAELLAPAGAAFMVARFNTFDPYYLPMLRRFSEDGLVAPVLVYLVLAIALVTAILIRVRPRPGSLLGVLAVLACAFLAVVMVGGH